MEKILEVKVQSVEQIEEVAHQIDFKFALSSFRELAKENHFDFIVTGSLALETLGLELNRSPKDIDVEVVLDENYHDTANNVFKALADSYGSDFYKQKENYPSNWENKPYIFKYKNVVFNVWVSREFTHKTFVYKDYIKYAGVSSVIREKMRLRRIKDYKDLNGIITNLLKFPAE